MGMKRTEHYIVYWQDDEETKNKLFDKMLDFFIRHETFDGESIAQSDGPLIEASELIEDIADDIFKFKAEYQ